jgi:hypothetical protein
MRLGATREALTAIVAVAWYDRGSFQTRSVPTMIERTTGTMNHHLRRPSTDT